MSIATVFGAFLVAFAGLLMGSVVWPFKLMRKYSFEHWWFVGMLTGLILIPWAVTLGFCPKPIESIGQIPLSTILVGNLFSIGWGIANVLYGICIVRIGVALSGAILTGFGVSVGAIVPMIFKGSGLFANAASLGSPAGMAVLAGVFVVLSGVVLVALAGFGRERILNAQEATSGGFAGGLAMSAVAGVLSAFISFVFVYCQGPITANLSRVYPGSVIEISIDKSSAKYAVSEAGAVEIQGIGTVTVGGLSAREAGERIQAAFASGAEAETVAAAVAVGSIAANTAVWALAMLGGAFINIGYAVFLMMKNNSWGVLFASPKEASLAALIGVFFCASVTFTGTGMLFLGALGASVGWGIQQAMQMIGAQGLGFISGEWRGVGGRPRRQMYAAIVILIAAAIIMAYGNTLAKS